MIKVKNSYKKNLKRFISVLVSVLTGFSLLAASACNKPKTIEDYPEPVVITSAPATEDEGKEVSTAKEEEKEEKIDEVFLDEFDSLKERGKFEYNPTALHPVYKMEMKKNPKVVKVAKLILQAVYDVEPTLVLDGDYECSDSEFDLARKLAGMSSPMIYCVEFDSEDKITYNITYFPTYSTNEFLEVNVEGGISPEEAKAKFEDYEDLVTGIINNNLTDKDDNMQRAAKIYKALIEEFELDYESLKEEENTEEEEVPEEEHYFSNNSYLDVVNSKKISPWLFLDLYDFFMVQLNVRTIQVGASGQYKPQTYAKMDEIVNNSRGWAWLVVYDGDNSYNCDIILDKIALDVQRETFEGYESELIYFGMSDKKRDESFKVYYELVLQTLNPVGAQGLPKCENDYKLDL